MKVKPKHYARALLDIVEETKGNEEAKKQIKKFAELLAKNNHVSMTSKIIDQFENLWNQKKGIVRVEVVSAHKLNKETLIEIRRYLKEDGKAGEIEMKTKIDKSLIGGVVIRKGDRVLDQSLSARLLRINEIMNK